MKYECGVCRYVYDEVLASEVFAELSEGWRCPICDAAKIYFKPIDEEKLRASDMDFGIVTVSLTDLKAIPLYKEQIPVGQLADFLMASANLPLFKITPIEGKMYLDGGFYDNCPVNMLVRKGYKEIFVIRTLSSGIIRKIEDPSVKITNIIPSKSLGNGLNFEHDHIMENIHMGYCDTMRILKDIKGLNYYIDNIPDEHMLLSRLLKIPDDVIDEVGAKMKVSDINSHRKLFEKILPTLATRFSLPVSWEYRDIILRILEEVAKIRHIEQYKIWNFDAFVHEITSSKTINEVGKDYFESALIRLCDEIIIKLNSKIDES